MHILKINTTTIPYASSWDELSKKNLIAISALSELALNETQFKIHALCALTGIEIVKDPVPDRNPEDRSERLYKIKLPDKSKAYLSALQLIDLADSMDFLLKKNEDAKGNTSVHLDSHLTMNLIPSFKIDGINYFGPSVKLFNLTFSEFIHAETSLKRFTQKKDKESLDKLIAILYRKERSDYDPNSVDYRGDRREVFNDFLIDANAKKIRKLNMNVKMSIYLFYTGCQWWIMQQFPHVFKSNTKKQDNARGLNSLVATLTAGDVTKTNQVRESYLMDVMETLESAAIDYEKMKIDLKKH